MIFGAKKSNIHSVASEIDFFEPNFGFKNIGLTPDIQKGCFQHPQDVVRSLCGEIGKF